MARKKYTAEHHRRAFEVYYETRSMLQVSERIGTTYQTAFGWAAGKFNCVEGCPWHNWDNLIKERELATSARHRLLNAGNYDPLDHDAAIREAVENVEGLPARREAVYAVIRSDNERIGHWELLYAKVFYSITGLIIDHNGLDHMRDQAELQQLFLGGMSVSSFESGVRLLGYCQARISDMSAALPSDAQTPEEEAQEHAGKVLSIGTLLEVKKKLEHLSDVEIDSVLATIPHVIEPPTGTNG